MNNKNDEYTTSKNVKNKITLCGGYKEDITLSADKAKKVITIAKDFLTKLNEILNEK